MRFGIDTRVGLYARRTGQAVRRDPRTDPPDRKQGDAKADASEPRRQAAAVPRSLKQLGRLRVKRNRPLIDAADEAAESPQHHTREPTRRSRAPIPRSSLQLLHALSPVIVRYGWRRARLQRGNRLFRERHGFIARGTVTENRATSARIHFRQRPLHPFQRELRRACIGDERGDIEHASRRRFDPVRARGLSSGKRGKKQCERSGEPEPMASRHGKEGFHDHHPQRNRATRITVDAIARHRLGGTTPLAGQARYRLARTPRAGAICFVIHDARAFVMIGCDCPQLLLAKPVDIRPDTSATH